MYISHFNEPKETITSAIDKIRFIGRSATHVFPIGHLSPNPGTGFMYLMRCIPTGPKTSRQEFDVFKLHTQKGTPEDYQAMIEFYKRVESEDVALCNATQRNMERGVYVAGPLHPFREEGVIAFQEMVQRLLQEHLVLEAANGSEIWPARQDSKRQRAEDGNCTGMVGLLDW